jgi:polar amino acid transport system substrate-binding protein
MRRRLQMPALLAALLVPWPAAAADAPKPANKAQAVAAGHELFNENCEHCHGPDAVEGVEQRNLRHLYQRYGDKMDQVFMVTVTHGRVTKGMPNWSGILSQAQLRQILAFLHSVQDR